MSPVFTPNGAATAILLAARDQLARALVHRFLDARLAFFELGLALGEQPRHDTALADSDEQRDVLDDDPSPVLQEAPPLWIGHAVNRLGPDDPAREVIDRDDDGRGDEHWPVAVDGQERERGEYVEVRLDAAEREVDEQR